MAKGIDISINKTNADLGMTQDYWEHRSFEVQGLDIIQQIHLGEKASAMERVGIQTIRGNINRDIITQNAIIMAARAAYEKAKEELAEAISVPVTVVTTFKSEIVDIIFAVPLDDKILRLGEQALHRVCNRAN